MVIVGDEMERSVSCTRGGGPITIPLRVATLTPDPSGGYSSRSASRAREDRVAPLGRAATEHLLRSVESR